MSRLSPRDRRALWFGALLVLPVLSWRLFVVPLSDLYRTNVARAELASELLEREQALLVEGPRLPARLDSARTALLAEQSGSLVADDTVAAARALFAALRNSARAAELTEISIEGAPPARSTSALMEVQADLRAYGSTAALSSWLGALEAEEQLLVVDRLDLTVSGEERLAVSARVRGFARRPRADRAPGAGSIRSAERRRAPEPALLDRDPFGLYMEAPAVAESAPYITTPAIRLVGTMLGVDQPAAICKLGDAPARILHLGDTLGGWRLQQVAPGRALFIDGNGARHELRLSPLGN